MKKVLGFLGVLLILAAYCYPLEARTLISGRGIPVVSDPRDLSLVNLKPMSDYLYADLKNKGDFGLVRRVALAVKASQAGVPNPRKKMLHGGFVVGRGSGGNSSAVLVLVGDLKFKDLQSLLEKDYKEYMQLNKGTPAISEQEIEGVKFTTYAYVERPYEMWVAQIKGKKAIVFGAVPHGDLKILEDTLKVVLGTERLNDSQPAEIEAETTFSLSHREMERLVSFNKSKGSLRVKFANGMKTLAQKLGIPQSTDETVPLDERIRGRLALSKQISVKYHWDVDSSKASAYSVNYVISMKDNESAETLRNLVSEQIVRLSETARNSGDKDSLGRLTASANDADVQINFLLDTPEGQYQHASMLMSQLFHYRSVFSFLDRYGQGNPRVEE